MNDADTGRVDLALLNTGHVHDADADMERVRFSLGFNTGRVEVQKHEEGNQRATRGVLILPWF